MPPSSMRGRFVCLPQTIEDRYELSVPEEVTALVSPSTVHLEIPVTSYDSLRLQSVRALGITRTFVQNSGSEGAVCAASKAGQYWELMTEMEADLETPIAFGLQRQP